MERVTEICLLGATGSIGTQVLEIIRGKKEYKLTAVAFGRNLELGAKIIEEFRPGFVSVFSETDIKKLQKEFPDLEFGYGEEGLLRAATFSKGRL